MKNKQATTMMTLVLAIVAMAFWVTPVAADDGHARGIAPPQSHAYGDTLTGWMSTYLRWMYSGADPAQSMVGHVKMLPLPVGTQVGGDGSLGDPAIYVGQLEITLRPGTPFVLPSASGLWSGTQAIQAYRMIRQSPMWHFSRGSRPASPLTEGRLSRMGTRLPFMFR